MSQDEKKTIKINFLDTEGKDPAPLYFKYQNQVNPQPAYISIDLRDGAVDADYSGELGNAVPSNVWHSVVLRISLANATLSADQINELMDGHKESFQKILDGSEVEWDGSNYVGRLNAEAQSLYEHLENSCLGSDIESLFIEDLADWLTTNGEKHFPDADESVRAHIDNFDLDGYTTNESIEDALVKIWCNELHNGGALPPSVARFLVEEHQSEIGDNWIEEAEFMAQDATAKNILRSLGRYATYDPVDGDLSFDNDQIEETFVNFVKDYDPEQDNDASPEEKFMLDQLKRAVDYDHESTLRGFYGRNLIEQDVADLYRYSKDFYDQSQEAQAPSASSLGGPGI